MTPTMTSPRAHPLARSAALDAGIVAFSVLAVLLSFATGQAVANWHNIVFPPIVMVLAAITIVLVAAEIRQFARTAGESGHRVTALSEVVVALIAMVVVGPMLLIMPFVFLGAIV